jgi:hypothetical protein
MDKLQVASMYNLNIWFGGLFIVNMLKVASLVVGGTHEDIFNQSDIANAPLFNFSFDFTAISTFVVLIIGCEDVVIAMLCFCCM